MHGLVAQVALVLGLVIAAAATFLALTRRATGSFFLAGALWTGLVVALAAVLGVGVALTDHAPRDPLHIVYGVLAIGVVPGAAIVAGDRRVVARRSCGRLPGIVLVVLVMRLFQTGG